MLPVPDSTWSLVAKIDEHELYATVHQLAFWAGGIAFVLLGMSFAVLWVEMRRSQLRAYSRQLELEKRLMAHRFEDLSKFANDIFFLMDEEGRIVEVNDRALEVYGYSHEEFERMRGADLRTEEARRQFSSDWKRVLSDGYTNFETVHLGKHGQVIPVDVSMRMLQLGDERYVQSILRDVSVRKQTEQRLHYLAYYDDLTGLPNRTLFIDHFAQAMSAANRSSKRVGIMLLDLDHFKNVNDTLGHESGDLLLHQVSKRLRDCFREGDTLSRFGGDEFAVILADMARSEDAAPVARKILKVFEAPFQLGTHEIFVGVSIGISVYPEDGLNSGELMRNVDAAMYHSKALGRGNFQFYSAELTRRAQQRMALETGLRHAIERDELVLHYQPQIDAASGAIVGMEALVRWNQPGVGLVSPMDFIPVAEESGLIVPMGEWILRTACIQAKAWQQQGLPSVSIAINISSRQFASGQLVGQVKSVLQQTRLPANYLDFEITESLLIDGADTVVLPALNEFKSMGINLSIDDFGTGYSSLSYLKRFPIDKIKIDKSFVRGIPGNQENASLVKTIIAMALNLQLKVIAEGVETDEQRDHLLALECDQMQGFLFGRPLPAEAATELLKQAGAQQLEAARTRASRTA
jgi:diguanylate cyclase (GGDEF)-like protein/PAS domain S-box-containing protein